MDEQRDDNLRLLLSDANVCFGWKADIRSVWSAPGLQANVPKLATNCLASQMLLNLRVALSFQRPSNVRYVGTSAGARQFEGSLNGLLHTGLGQCSVNGSAPHLELLCEGGWTYALRLVFAQQRSVRNGSNLDGRFGWKADVRAQRSVTGPPGHTR